MRFDPAGAAREHQAINRCARLRAGDRIAEQPRFLAVANGLISRSMTLCRLPGYAASRARMSLFMSRSDCRIGIIHMISQAGCHAGREKSYEGDT